MSRPSLQVVAKRRRKFMLLAADPNNSQSQIISSLGISRVTVWKWSKELASISSVEAKKKKAKRKIALAEKLVKQEGMTKRKLKKELKIRENYRLHSFCIKNHINIGHLPLGKKAERKKKSPVKCKRCRKRSSRARGFCRTCHQWARWNGLIGSGRKCRWKTGCKKPVYGNFPYCSTHFRYIE